MSEQVERPRALDYDGIDHEGRSTALASRNVCEHFAEVQVLRRGHLVYCTCGWYRFALTPLFAQCVGMDHVERFTGHRYPVEVLES